MDSEFRIPNPLLLCDARPPSTPQGNRAKSGILKKALKQYKGLLSAARRALRAPRLIGLIGVIGKFAIKINKNQGFYRYL